MDEDDFYRALGKPLADSIGTGADFVSVRFIRTEPGHPIHEDAPKA